MLTINEGADFTHTIQGVAEAGDVFSAILVDRFGRLTVHMQTGISGEDVTISLDKQAVDKISTPPQIRIDESSAWGGWYYVTRTRGGESTRVDSGKWEYSPIIRSAL